MLSSIPLIAPRDAHSLWYTPTSTFSFAPPSSGTTNPQSLSSPPVSQNIHPSALPNPQQTSRFRVPSISPLTQLALDEESVYQRKINIQRFGATWIKPPGIPKTYQVELDEEKERREAERQAMMEDVEATGEDGVFDDTAGDLERDAGDGGDGEPDLDADIPEAESYDDEDDDDEEDDLDDRSDFSGPGNDEVDLDAEVPEAETETLWNDSDEEEDEEDEGEDEGEDDYEDEEEEEEIQEGPDSSPHQAMYSHDEHFGPPDSRLEQRLRQYTRRSLLRSDDGMEMDSD